jgi:hypothetical protein
LVSRELSLGLGFYWTLSSNKELSHKRFLFRGKMTIYLSTIKKNKEK